MNSTAALSTYCSTVHSTWSLLHRVLLTYLKTRLSTNIEVQLSKLKWSSFMHITYKEYLLLFNYFL